MFFRSKVQDKDKDKDKESKIQYIVVGLGNPGQKYTYTRHNAGFLALDYISQKHEFNINRVNFKSLYNKFTVESTVSVEKTEDSEATEEKKHFGVIFMKPQTFMNNSGQAVSEAANFYKIPPQNILVISDDIALPVGKIRIRRGGSDGGHNGLESIIYHLHSDKFPRIKIGIGDKPHPDFPLERWVLSEFPKDERKIIFDIFGNVHEAVDVILKENNFDKVMNKFN